MYPVIGHATEENYPLNYIKGKICTQTFISEFYEHKENIMFSIKPKITIIAISINCPVRSECNICVLRHPAGDC